MVQFIFASDIFPANDYVTPYIWSRKWKKCRNQMRLRILTNQKPRDTTETELNVMWHKKKDLLQWLNSVDRIDVDAVRKICCYVIKYKVSYMIR